MIESIRVTDVTDVTQVIYVAKTGSPRPSHGVVKDFLDQAFWGLSQPGLDDQLVEGRLVDPGEFDKNGRIAVEMWVV
jgi:hypothetical protein